MSMNIVVDVEPKEEDLQVVLDGLRKYNDSKRKRIERKKLGVFLKDDTGNIIGGIEAHYFAKWIHIEYLWIEEQYRGKDYGTKLIAETEKKGIELGCNMITVGTFSFQAPEFYLKNGFEVFGKLDDNPEEGMTRFYYKKRLA